MSGRSIDGATGRRAALVVHPRDNVAVALRDLWPDEEVRLAIDGAIHRLIVAGKIAMGHKFSIHAIDSGEVIRKYGEAIGVATTSIDVGEHVHVHNLTSQRARDAPR
ncbi:UxaA family hydrolase [Paraburkholderia fungorum]|uniref:UxaA family hydrolase n=1 Tax=Paraburkholderia fungorum TaxID=134537 RepID=UPI001C7D02F0|nr:UxaA family hydrolase [Paraburkholderia fungorum]